LIYEIEPMTEVSVHTFLIPFQDSYLLTQATGG
jgi:hypothetical protein